MSAEKMIQVHIEGVRRYFVRSDLYVVTLLTEEKRRLFNIMIGQSEAYEIAMGLHHIEAPRPMTLHFMAQTLRATGVNLEEVRIEQFQSAPLPVLYATARLRNGDNVQELDVRPSDALSLALLLDRPIGVSASLMEQMGVELPEGKTPEVHYAEELLAREGIVLPEGKKLRLGYSKTPARDAVLKEIKALLLGIPMPPREADFERAKRAYLTYLLGEDYVKWEKHTKNE